MTCISGKEFNEIHAGKTFWKLTSQDEIHNDFRFSDGLNIDTIPFNPSKSCQAEYILQNMTKYIYGLIMEAA